MPVPSFSLAEKFSLLAGSLSPDFFLNKTRPMLYRKFKEPEKVHAAVLGEVSRYAKLIKPLSLFFTPSPLLKIRIKGIELVPFGTAAGFDKDAEALLPLSYFFGFLEPGTVTVMPRAGNPEPRVYSDDNNFAVFNAQGFPSKGLGHFKANLAYYRKHKGKKPVFANICGLPVPAIDDAFDQIETLVKELRGLVDGFVWDPVSPNTASLKLLRTAEVFEKTASLLKRQAGNKLKLVKMWPYEQNEKAFFMKLLHSFIDNGGDGVVAVNTKQVKRSAVPAAEWGYASAGLSGKPLKSYRIRSVKAIRDEFRDIVIVATGGIFDGDDAYETFKAGANMLEGFTPYVFYGVGLVRQLEKKVEARLKSDGIDLETLQSKWE